MQHDQYVYRIRRKRGGAINFFRFISFIFVYFISLFLLFFALWGKLFVNPPLISPLAAPLIQSSIPLKDTFNRQGKLNEVINALLKDEAENYGIIVTDLKSNENYSLNEHKMFETASLYKLWLMAVVFEQIEKGILKKTDTLSQKIEILNEKFKIATDSAELTEGEITLTVGEALRQMITISDNYSAFLLAEKTGLSNITSYLDLEGLNESKIGTSSKLPVTSAYDTALFFEKLYKNDKKGTEKADEMLELLKNQHLNSKIPKYLPKDVNVAHKTGELGEYSHDAGIVYSPHGDYIIVVLTKTKNTLETDEKIAQISKAVYDYFREK